MDTHLCASDTGSGFSLYLLIFYRVENGLNESPGTHEHSERKEAMNKKPNSWNAPRSGSLVLDMKKANVAQTNFIFSELLFVE